MKHTPKIASNTTSKNYDKRFNAFDKIELQNSIGCKKFLRPVHLASRWSLHRGSVLRILKQGKLPYYRIGRSVLISEQDIEQFETVSRKQRVLWEVAQ
jgi:excisionase family DNA binding protein